MKNYHEQLRPHVMPYVTNYVTDFTKHDKEALDGYTGEFYFGMRKSGTNTFCVDPVEGALKTLQACKPTDFFTANGLRWIYNGEITAEKLSLELASLLSTVLGNDRFFIGKHGKISELPRQKFIIALKKRLEPIQQMLDELRGVLFVWNLMQSVEKLEIKAKQDKDAAAQQEWEIKVLSK